MDKLQNKLCLAFQKITTNVFFREIKVIGQENIPQDAPVIICGNHSNQFIDALLMGATAGRKVNFIMAAASMRRPIHGSIGKFLGCIPVERPRDLAKPGKGTIISAKSGVLIGKETEFKTQCHKNTQIIVGFIKDQLRVTEVISDTELHYTTDIDEGDHENLNEKYRICPDIDQSDLFGSVWKSLNKKQCIGIFPEGISHDSPNFMPLKAGVCIMALGAMQKFRQKVYIVPCGLNYFKGHRFRSKVTIQYGQPFEIPFELADLYKNNKREAITTLLLEIQNRLRSVVYTASTSAELQAIITAKHLYLQSFKKKLSTQEECQLINRINETYRSLQTHPDMIILVNQLKDYNSIMTRLKLTDQETVADYQDGFFKSFLAILYSILHILISSLLAFPGLILNGPIGLVLRYLAESARKKEAIGWPSPCLDIVASYKVSFGLVIVPVTFWLYYLVFFFFLKNFIFSADQIQLIYSIEILFILLYPVYAYLMLRLFDDIKKHFKAIRARVVFLHKNIELAQQEKDIQNKIKDMVNVYCKAHEENYDENKIITDDNQNGDADLSKQLLGRREKFIFRLQKIKQVFSQPIKKIAHKLQSKIYSESTMQDIYRYLDVNKSQNSSSEHETDD
ncbi:hypothetical protein ABPG72_016652 [Tetrahymena utriculariae]